MSKPNDTKHTGTHTKQQQQKHRSYVSCFLTLYFTSSSSPVFSKVHFHLFQYAHSSAYRVPHLQLPLRVSGHRLQHPWVSAT